MTTLFISYATADASKATELGKALELRGYEGVFVAHESIEGGENWRESLFHNLRVSRAMVLLWSRASAASKWCHSEVGIFRFQGKPVVPIRLDGHALDDLLEASQSLPLHDGPDPFEGLWSALDRLGLSAQDSFEAIDTPYPGFEAFDERHAGVYFGREEEIHEGLDRLRRRREPSGSKLLLIGGPSGSGKSSLMRAGILPRLKKDLEHWLPLSPFRPGTDSLGELSRAFALAFSQHGPARVVSLADVPTPGAAAVALARELTLAVGTPEATVVVSIDQLEDVFQTSKSNETALLGFLAEIETACSAGLVVLATIRTDALSTLQTREVFRGVAARPMLIGTLAASRFRSIIEEPAKRLGLSFESDLVDQLVADAPNAEALPLVAFTLERMFASLGNDRVLKLDPHYKAVGGVGGAVKNVVDAIQREYPVEEKLLRGLFGRLATLNDELKFVRQKVLLSEIPTEARPTVDRFANRRLLSKDGVGDSATVEVTHEALFELWVELKGWLAEDRDFHLWKKRFQERRELSRTP